MATTTTTLASDAEIVERLLAHIASGTTDVAEEEWHEPVANYLDEQRFVAELALLRATPAPFCPSGALPEPGSYLSRLAAGTPIVVTRDQKGSVHAFVNVCRHRGASVVCDAGRAASLVCPYHGWVYQLDGALRRVSHEHGFPDVDKAANGLVALPAVERHGLVFVSQGDGAEPDAAVEAMAGHIDPMLTIHGSTIVEEPVNWKILAETFLEGYHIRFLHHSTFFPLQYDNVNTIETFGRHRRIAFPYRNIERPFDTSSPADVRRRLTFVYHLFPNVMVATFPGQVLVVVLDPTAVDRTNVVTYALRPALDADDARAAANPGLVNSGGAEDFAVARTVQQGLASGANTHLRFGRFEGAIAHFHRELDNAVGVGTFGEPNRR